MGVEMEFLTVFLIAVGLAMDAFAVSVSNGVTICDFKRHHAVKLGAYFGCFQFLMPLIGWLMGTSVKAYIEAIDHWIAFILLGVIGLNMIIETFKNNEAEDVYSGKMACEVLTPHRLLVQAVATSIDALVVGISFALLDINILYAAAIIGFVAFIFSYVGGILGERLGMLFKKKAELFGGIILIGIGAKILIEHLFF